MRSNLKNQNTISAGYLNLNLLNYNKKPETHPFPEGIFKNNFLKQTTLPTRVTKNSAKLIDNILVNKEQVKTTSGNFTTSILDHFP